MDIVNLIITGIVILVILLFRLIDRSRNSLGKVGKYIDKRKIEIDEYFKRKSLDIKDLHISLDVEKKSADLLMQRIKNITREELNNKVQALTMIDERIRDYDSSLEELVQMTGRVQENLNRIQEESAYVEGIGKRLHDFREKAEFTEGKIDHFEKKLKSIEQSFVFENKKSLEKAVTDVLNEAGSTIKDFEANAQTIERKLEDHREAIEHLEQGRKERLARDEVKIEKLLAEALEKAGSKADKTEETALLKLKEQAQERLNQVKNQFEEKIKIVQEAVKSKLTDYKEITDGILKQKKEWEELTRNTGQDIITAVEDRLELYRAGQDEQFRQLTGLTNDNSKLKLELELAIQKAIEKVNNDFSNYNKEIEENWEKSSSEFNSHLQSVRKELAGIDLDITGIKEKSFLNISKKLKGFEDDFLSDLSKRKKEIDHQLTAWQETTNKRIESISDEAKSSAENKFNKKISEYSARIKEFDESLEEMRSKTRELNKENDDRFTAARTSLDEISKELAAQSKLLDRTYSIKTELKNYIDGMGSNIDRITQLKNEIARFENQFTQIKRLEDDVNTKMTRFLSEKHRIEVMENDFKRMLQISQSVEEKLSQVSNSDDILQSMQIQLRRLDDIIKDTEEKYQRIERKSKTIQETNDGIDRNFKALQEDEQSVERLKETITVIKKDMEAMQSSILALSSENEKAKEAAEKVSTLDDSIKYLDKRIAEMNVAREGLARLATELQSLEKDAKSQVKMIRTLLDREEGKTLARAGKTAEKNPLSPDIRENIIKLKRQGWSVDEIARALKISKGEVELYIEIGLKD